MTSLSSRNSTIVAELVVFELCIDEREGRLPPSFEDEDESAPDPIPLATWALVLNRYLWPKARDLVGK